MKATMKIRMMAAGAACLCAALSASATEWTYSASGTTYTITDGQWTLKVGKLAATNTSLKVTGISTWAEPATDSDKKGVLDLRSPLTVTVDDATATITSVEVGKSAFVSSSLVAFYCDLISSMDAGGYCFANNANLTRLEIGGSAEIFPGLITMNDSALTDAKFNFPNLRQVGNTAGNTILGATSSLNPIDIATVATPGVTNVLKGAYAHAKLGGDLVLTNVMAIGDRAFEGAVLTNVTLTGSLAALPATAFKGSTITNVVLDLPNLESIAATAFSGQKYIRSIELVSAFSDMGQITNLLKEVKTSQNWQLATATGCRVYISKRQWTKEARETATQAGYFTSAFNDKETAMIKGDNADPTLAKAYGMITVGSLNKAFVVDKPSPHDKIPGLIIIIQ